MDSLFVRIHGERGASAVGGSEIGGSSVGGSEIGESKVGGSKVDEERGWWVGAFGN